LLLAENPLAVKIIEGPLLRMFSRPENTAQGHLMIGLRSKVKKF